MAQCMLTAQEYIRSSFSPQVAVLPSEDAENICLKNNLRFVELLQPFCNLLKDVYLTDPAGNSVSQKNLKIVFDDMNNRPVQPTFGKKMLSEIILHSPVDQVASKKICSGKGLDIALNLQSSTPWFEAWRELFLQIQYPSDHEFTKHYVACIIVISSGSENPLDQLHRLSQYQHQQQHQNDSKFPKWFSPNILKFYLLLHDVQQTNIEKANSIYKDMQNTYGNSHCYLLQINSGHPNQTEPQKRDLWLKYIQQKRFFDSGFTMTSEASSGTGTPRDDMGGFPARVSEGDSESSDLVSHPLSPVPNFPDDKNGVFDNGDDPAAIPNDIPFILNKETLVGRVTSASHGSWLTGADIDRIRQFTSDFCSMALIPHVERQIKYLSDVVANRSRSKSLFSATRRWLGGSKPPSGTVTNSVVYSPEATELQTRRLGDLCFMFGHYELAYNTFVTAKNDFKHDLAWLYFAGAQEMAALSSFMHSGVDYPKRYFEGSLHTYLNVCKVYNFAIRLTLLSTEVLKHFCDYSDAAMTFLKMTSEESDLLSALMLEQAAHCFVNMKLAFPRKYAFHMTLAGHRFGKAGQRNHSLRAYNQALQIYKDRCWVLAEDHIHFTMSKQAFHLKERQQSVDAIMCLVNQVFKNTSSQQSASQQLAYFKEFLTVVKDYTQQTESEKEVYNLLNLSIPAIDPSSTKVLIGTPVIEEFLEDGWINASGYSFADEESREARWLALEKELVTKVHGTKMIFKPKLQRLSNSTPNTIAPEVPVHELVQFEFSVCNPLLINITVLNIYPIFDYFDESGSIIGEEGCLRCESLPGFNMPPESQDFIRLRVWPERLGRFIIKGVKFGISLTSDVTLADQVNKNIIVEGQHLFEIKGQRLNNTLAEKRSVTYSKDLRLSVTVTEAMPRLAVFLKEPPALLSCGQIFPIEVLFKNVGQIPLNQVHYASSDPRAICFLNGLNKSDGIAINCRLSTQEQAICRTKCRAEIIPITAQSLQPGETFKGCFWLHTPFHSGAFDVELLFYFQNANRNDKGYRLARHLSSIFLEKCLTLSASSSISNNYVLKNNNMHNNFCNIIIHVKNNCDSELAPDNITLISACAISSNWKLFDQLNVDLMAIGTRESSRLCLNCVRLEDEGNLVLSIVNLVETLTPPLCWKDFALRERIKLDDLLAEPPPPNKAANYIPPAPTQQEIDMKYMSKASDMDLVLSLLWKGRRGSEEMWGQHTVHLRRLGDSSIVPSNADLKVVLVSAKDVKPARIIPLEEPKLPLKKVEFNDLEITNVVKSSVSFPRFVEHDFNKCPLCTFEYIYTVFNCTACCLEAVVKFCSKESQKQSTNRIPSQQSNWNILPVGNTIQKITLGPWQFKSVSVKSIVSFPGGYLVGATTVEIRTAEGTQSWTQKRKEYYNHVWITDVSKSNS